MRQNLSVALKNIGRSEGGYSNHPNDPGGPTMKGVTLKTYKAYCKRKGRPAPSIADLKEITQAEVHEIFVSQYWDTVHGDDLPSGLDYAASDFAFNSGPGQAIKTLQRVLGGLETDGKYGNHTAAAIKRAVERSGGLAHLIDAYCDARLKFMRGLKNWSSFKNGWTTRVKEVREWSQALAEGGVVAAPPPTSVPVADPSNTKMTALPGATASSTAIIGAVGAGLASAASTLLDMADTAANLAPWFIGGFIVLTVVGGIFAALAMRQKVKEDGVV